MARIASSCRRYRGRASSPWGGSTVEAGARSETSSPSRLKIGLERTAVLDVDRGCGRFDPRAAPGLASGRVCARNRGGQPRQRRYGNEPGVMFDTHLSDQLGRPHQGHRRDGERGAARPRRTALSRQRAQHRRARDRHGAGRLAHLIHELADTYPLLLVDTAGFGNQAAVAAMASADAILIPTMTGRRLLSPSGLASRHAFRLTRDRRRSMVPGSSQFHLGHGGLPAAPTAPARRHHV